MIHEQTGVMADYGDIDGLKRCWERLLFNEEFGREQGQNGREHVINNYSAKRMADEYTNLYLEVMFGS